MTKKGVIVLIVVIVLVVGGVFLIFAKPSSNSNTNTSGNSTSTTSNNPTSTVPVFDQSISNGVVTIAYPSADFGLATSQTQILVHPYIPPCDSNFNYCLYYIGSAYQGTNFESAGIRVLKRTDLTAQAKCLTTPPAGFTNMTPTTATTTDYAVSVFSPLGDAAAGHFANGALYRLYYKGVCYEFETRVGQSDFANYPSGTIQPFTGGEQIQIQSELTSILSNMKLPSGETISFPS